MEITEAENAVIHQWGAWYWTDSWTTPNHFSGPFGTRESAVEFLRRHHPDFIRPRSSAG